MMSADGWAGRPRVAVIGAGISGLAAVKCSLDEGLLPVCYEQHDDIGGTWYYTEEIRANQGAAAFKNLISNVVKEVMAFSDFPMSDDYPIFMSPQRYQTYLRDYAKHFDLTQHIHLNHTVVNVKPTTDFADTGRWEVTTRKVGSGKNEVEVFDSVFICSGYLKKPKIPDLPGRELFNGEVLHSLTYRRPEMFHHKRVLVVGRQSSAADVACDATATASQVWLSAGEGTWVLTRTGPGGIPNEYTGKRWYGLLPPSLLGKGMISIAKSTLDHTRYQFGDGGNPATDGTLALCDDLPPRIIGGRIKVVPRVTGFTQTGVTLADGSSLHVDIVVFATGFGPSYDFVKCADIQSESSVQFNWYKCVFPLNNGGHDSLAMIDAHPILGSHVPSIELSCRWASRVFSGKCKLPTREKMEKYAWALSKYYREHCNNKFKGTWIKHSDDLADEIGVRPTFLSLLLRSPSTAYKVHFGPAFPCHYRLLGPGAWPGAWRETHRIYNHINPPSSLFRFLLKLTLCLAIPAAIAAKYYQYEWLFSFANHVRRHRWLSVFFYVFKS